MGFGRYKIVGNRRIACAFLIVVCVPALASCRSGDRAEPMPVEPDLVVYTAQEEAVCEPVIKEFEERTDLLVRVEYGSSEGLIQYLQESMWDGG